MSNTQQHLAQAKHNEALTTNLFSTLEYKDWLITASYYAAIHYVEAKLADRPDAIHPKDEAGADASPHAVRGKCVNRYYNPIFTSYRMLEQRSREARYGCLCNGFTDEDARKCLLVHLKTIKNHFGYQQA